MPEAMSQCLASLVGRVFQGFPWKASGMVRAFRPEKRERRGPDPLRCETIYSEDEYNSRDLRASPCPLCRVRPRTADRTVSVARPGGTVRHVRRLLMSHIGTA